MINGCYFVLLAKTGKIKSILQLCKSNKQTKFERFFRLGGKNSGEQKYFLLRHLHDTV